MFPFFVLLNILMPIIAIIAYIFGTIVFAILSFFCGWGLTYMDGIMKGFINTVNKIGDAHNETNKAFGINNK